jgi:hypothetical protein
VPSPEYSAPSAPIAARRRLVHGRAGFYRHVAQLLRDFRILVRELANKESARLELAMRFEFGRRCRQQGRILARVAHQEIAQERVTLTGVSLESDGRECRSHELALLNTMKRSNRRLGCSGGKWSGA